MATSRTNGVLCIPGELFNQSSRAWTYFIFSIFFVKFLIFVLDPLVMFFYGDSQCYLNTALYSWFPMDRSFIYGLIIRLVSYLSHSLTSLIVLQIFTSSISCIVLAYVLCQFLQVQPLIAYLMGLLCALEPIQLIFERYILTETFSLFSFAIYILLIFIYLRSPRLVLLLSIQILGISLISLRLSFLPLVLVNTALVPLLGSPIIIKKAITSGKRHAFLLVALHMLASVILTYGLHLGYKHLNGHLTKLLPAYQYHSGFFLLADWSPVVESADFPLPELREKIFGTLKFNLKDRRERGAQRWGEGGLISNIRSAVPDCAEAEQLSKKTAVNAFKRDPLGVLKLGAAGFIDYWHTSYLHGTLVRDKEDWPLKPDMLELLRKNYSISGERLHELKTLTNVYYLSAKPWYLFLLCAPGLAGFVLFSPAVGNKRELLILFVATSCLVAIAIFLIERPTVRYLHPVAWLTFISIGIVLDSIKRQGSVAEN